MSSPAGFSLPPLKVPKRAMSRQQPRLDSDSDSTTAEPATPQKRARLDATQATNEALLSPEAPQQSDASADAPWNDQEEYAQDSFDFDQEDFGAFHQSDDILMDAEEEEEQEEEHEDIQYSVDDDAQERHIHEHSHHHIDHGFESDNEEFDDPQLLFDNSFEHAKQEDEEDLNESPTEAHVEQSNEDSDLIILTPTEKPSDDNALEFQHASDSQPQPQQQPERDASPLPPPEPAKIERTETRNGQTYFRSFDGLALTQELVDQGRASDPFADIGAKIQGKYTTLPRIVVCAFIVHCITEYATGMIEKLNEIASELAKFNEFQTKVIQQLDRAKTQARNSLESTTAKRSKAQQNAQTLLKGGGVMGSGGGGMHAMMMGLMGGAGGSGGSTR
ncbi:hypothetical protein HDU98_011384 [Podochytrium sp. JEL0797]|nr:hypothetical protein HDU98_011384 [Podochytrium sp. JEL0797]